MPRHQSRDAHLHYIYFVHGHNGRALKGCPRPRLEGLSAPNIWDAAAAMHTS